MQLRGCVTPYRQRSKRLKAEKTQQRLEQIILRMQNIQKAIKASRQPPSMLELGELKELGNEYARIIDDLGHFPEGTGLA